VRRKSSACTIELNHHDITLGIAANGHSEHLNNDPILLYKALHAAIAHEARLHTSGHGYKARALSANLSALSIFPASLALLAMARHFMASSLLASAAMAAQAAQWQFGGAVYVKLTCRS
jgi:hypothetical protein